jgi:hypothetical protein
MRLNIINTTLQGPYLNVCYFSACFSGICSPTRINTSAIRRASTLRMVQSSLPLQHHIQSKDHRRLYTAIQPIINNAHSRVMDCASPDVMQIANTNKYLRCAFLLPGGSQCSGHTADHLQIARFTRDCEHISKVDRVDEVEDTSTTYP